MSKPAFPKTGASRDHDRGNGVTRDDTPILGAAMLVSELPEWRSWLIESRRDLEIQDFIDPSVLANGWRERVDEARRHLDGYRGRLGIHGPFVGFSLAGGDSDIDAVARRRLEQALDVAARLGADQIVIHSPFTQWMHRNRDAGLIDFQMVADRVHELIDSVLRRAVSLGIVFVLENIEDIDPGSRALIVEAANSPALALSVDTGHAACAHAMAGGPPVDAFICAAGSRLQHVHLADNDGHADRHWPPGEGSAPWKTIFKALADLPNNPRLILELKDRSQIPIALKTLRNAGLAQ